MIHGKSDIYGLFLLLSQFVVLLEILVIIH